MGNPKYLAPEQLLDDDITEAVDIYGLGVMAYELLSGEGPFQSRTPADLVKAHLTSEAPDIRERRPEVPVSVAELLIRCLAREPTHRPTAADVVRILDGGTALEQRSDEAIDIQTLLKKRIPQTVLITGGVSIFLAQLVGDFDNPRLYSAALVLAGTAIVVSAIVAWFHGEKGRQRAPAVEYILLTAVVAAGVALSAWVLLGG